MLVLMDYNLIKVSLSTHVIIVITKIFIRPDPASVHGALAVAYFDNPRFTDTVDETLEWIKRGV